MLNLKCGVITVIHGILSVLGTNNDRYKKWKCLQDILYQGDRNKTMGSHSSARVGTKRLKVLTIGSFPEPQEKEKKKSFNFSDNLWQWSNLAQGRLVANLYCFKMNCLYLETKVQLTKSSRLKLKNCDFWRYQVEPVLTFVEKKTQLFSSWDNNAHWDRCLPPPPWPWTDIFGYKEWMEMNNAVWHMIGSMLAPLFGVCLGFVEVSSILATLLN